MANRDISVYQLILHPQDKLPSKEADPKMFALMVQNEMQDIMGKLASPDKMITIDGQTFDKTTSLGAIIINDKLSELENRNTQNFSILSAIKRAEDSLRNMMG